MNKTIHNEEILEEIKKKYRNLLILKDFGYQEPFCFNNEDSANSAHCYFGCGDVITFAKLQKNEDVLDLGCGCGDDCIKAFEFVGENAKIVGIDMLSEMLKRAKKQVSTKNIHNIEFHLGFIEDIPLNNESFDLIISNCVINLSLNKKKVFEESFRLLKKGGRIAISDILKKETSVLQDNIDINNICNCIGNASSIEEYKKLLTHAGFKHIQIETSSLNNNQNSLCKALIQAYKE